MCMFSVVENKAVANKSEFVGKGSCYGYISALGHSLKLVVMIGVCLTLLAMIGLCSTA